MQLLGILLEERWGISQTRVRHTVKSIWYSRSLALKVISYSHLCRRMSAQARQAYSTDRPYSIGRPKSTTGNAIRVIARVRERCSRESHQTLEAVIAPLDGQRVSVTHRNSERRYTYASVLGTLHTQADMYMDAAGAVAADLLDGYSTTIMAYGQTGTGKTYTIMGPRVSSLDAQRALLPSDGIIPRLLYDIFQKIEARGTDTMVTCQYIEIYNENLRDLLSYENFKPSDTQSALGARSLRLVEGSQGSTLQGAVERVVDSATTALAVILAANARRQVAATNLNAESSRSHTIMTVSVTTRQRGADPSNICTSRVHLVDLAGSENVGRAGGNRDRAKEAGQINQSLLSLGRVIVGLAERSSHIPFRSSKLTRILQDALCGGSKTTLIATVSAAPEDIEESISTLEYASRAASIAPRLKQSLDDEQPKFTSLSALASRLQRLQHEIDVHRQRDGYTVLETNAYNELIEQSERQTQLQENLDRTLNKIVDLQQQIATLNADNAGLRGSLRKAELACSQLEGLQHELSGKEQKLSALEIMCKNLETASAEAAVRYQESSGALERLLCTEKESSRRALGLLKEAVAATELILTKLNKDMSAMQEGDQGNQIKESQLACYINTSRAFEQFEAKLEQIIVSRSELIVSELRDAKALVEEASHAAAATLEIAAKRIEPSLVTQAVARAKHGRTVVDSLIRNLTAQLATERQKQIAVYEEALANLRQSSCDSQLAEIAQASGAALDHIELGLAAATSPQDCEDGDVNRISSVELVQLMAKISEHLDDATTSSAPDEARHSSASALHDLNEAVRTQSELHTARLASHSALTEETSRNTLELIQREARVLDNLLASSMQSLGNGLGSGGAEKSRMSSRASHRSKRASIGNENIHPREEAKRAKVLPKRVSRRNGSWMNQ